MVCPLFLVLYWYDGQSWQTAQTIGRRHPASDGQLHLIEVVLPVAAANNPGFRIGFGMWNSDTADYGFIDDVLLSGVPMNP